MIAVRSTVALLAVCLAALILALPAPGSFPGSNGRIAVGGTHQPDAFTTLNGLFSVQSDGTDLKPFWALGYYSDRAPEFSPAGDQVAFVDDERLTIGMLDGSGTWMTGLTQVECVANPTWSPDGKSLLFTGQPPGAYAWWCGPPEIYSIDVGGTNLKRLTYSSTAEFWAEWAPDGKHIAILASDNPWGPRDVYVVDVAAGTAGNLTDTPYTDESRADWSPDGARLAFTSFAWPSTTLTSVRFDGTGAAALPLPTGMSPVSYTAPAWSPDGKSIAYIGGAPSSYPEFVPPRVRIVSAGGGSSATTLAAPTVPQWGLSWQANPETTTTPPPPVPDPPKVDLPPPAADNPVPSFFTSPALRKQFIEIVTARLGEPLVKGGIRSLLAGWTFTFPAPAAGDIEARLLTAPRGARMAKKAKPVVLARGAAKAGKAGNTKVKVKPTRKGKRLLKAAKRMKVTLRLTYRPQGLAALVAQKQVTIRRKGRR